MMQGERTHRLAPLRMPGKRPTTGRLSRLDGWHRSARPESHAAHASVSQRVRWFAIND